MACRDTNVKLAILTPIRDCWVRRGCKIQITALWLPKTTQGCCPQCWPRPPNRLAHARNIFLMVYITVSKRRCLRQGVYWSLEKKAVCRAVKMCPSLSLKMSWPSLVYVNVLKIWKTRGSITQSSLIPPQSAAYKVIFESDQHLSKTVGTL